MSTEPVSKLQQILSQGEFAVTAECGPPRGAGAEIVRKKGELLNGSAGGPVQALLPPGGRPRPPTFRLLPPR